MSWSPHPCHACHHPLTHFHGTLDFGPPFACALSWVCPSCHARRVELCSLGPDEPRLGHCVECDAALDAGGRCKDCGCHDGELEARVFACCGAPPTAEAILELLERGRHRVAFNGVNLRLRADPRDVEARVTKAKLLAEVHRPAQAAALFRRILDGEFGPCPDPALAVELGVNLANSGAHEQAIAVYQQFVAAHPGHEAQATVLSNLGACLSALGQIARSESFHRQAVAAEPDNMGARWNLFANLLKQRREAQALELLEETIELPALEAWERENLHAYRGKLLTVLGLHHEALAAFDASLVSDPGQPDRQFSRAELLIELRRFDEARSALIRVLQRCPTSEAAKRLLARVVARERVMLH